MSPETTREALLQFMLLTNSVSVFLPKELHNVLTEKTASLINLMFKDWDQNEAQALFDEVTKEIEEQYATIALRLIKPKGSA
jgi:hypothetical protein